MHIRLTRKMKEQTKIQPATSARCNAVIAAKAAKFNAAPKSPINMQLSKMKVICQRCIEIAAASTAAEQQSLEQSAQSASRRGCAGRPAVRSRLPLPRGRRPLRLRPQAMTVSSDRVRFCPLVVMHAFLFKSSRRAELILFEPFVGADGRQ